MCGGQEPWRCPSDPTTVLLEVPSDLGSLCGMTGRRVRPGPASARPVHLSVASAVASGVLRWWPRLEVVDLCGLCHQARYYRHRKSFIRVAWPAERVAMVVARVRQALAERWPPGPVYVRWRRP